MTFVEWCGTPAGQLWAKLYQLGAAEDAWEDATEAEREACAKLVEEWPGVMQYEEGCYCADIDELAHSIRERGKETNDA